MPQIFPLPCESFWRSVQNLFPLAELLFPTGKGKTYRDKTSYCPLALSQSEFQCISNSCLKAEKRFIWVFGQTLQKVLTNAK